MSISIPILITVAALWIFVPQRNYSRGLVLLSILPLVAFLSFQSISKQEGYPATEIGRTGLDSTQSVLMAFPSPAEGTQVFRKISSNILTISMPFWRGGFVPIGARATVVRTTSGKLAVFSPVSLTKEVKKEIDEFGGKVDYIIAPDFEHHMKLTEWVNNYKPSLVIGPEGLDKKRQKAGCPDIDNWVIFSKEGKLTQKIDPDFDKDFEYEYVESHPNKELVFNFRPERTMIQADLLFNMPATEQFSKAPQGFFGRWIGSFGSAVEPGSFHKTIVSYLFSRSNPDAFRQSMNRISKWDFDAIIPCHGESILTGGKAIFENLMADHIDKPGPDSPASPNL